MLLLKIFSLKTNSPVLLTVAQVQVSDRINRLLVQLIHTLLKVWVVSRDLAYRDGLSVHLSKELNEDS